MEAENRNENQEEQKTLATLELSDEERNEMLRAEIESLTQQLMSAQESVDESTTINEGETPLRSLVAETGEGEEEGTGDIISDIARQFKQMQEEMMSKINKLSTQVTDNDEHIQEYLEKHNELTNEKLQIETQKNQEVKELNSRIDGISSDFAQMLNQSLQEMQEKIEVASKR